MDLGSPGSLARVVAGARLGGRCLDGFGARPRIEAIRHRYLAACC
jgi:hypothetical protein